MAKLNKARSRIRFSKSNRVLIDQTCFGRSGGLAPISLPLFQGVRLLSGEQFSLSDVTVLLCYEGDEHAPPAKCHETMSAFYQLGRPRGAALASKQHPSGSTRASNPNEFDREARGKSQMGH